MTAYLHILIIFRGHMYDKIAEVSENYPDYIAYDFMGGKVKYKDFIS